MESIKKREGKCEVEIPYNFGRIDPNNMDLKTFQYYVYGKLLERLEESDFKSKLHIDADNNKTILIILNVPIEDKTEFEKYKKIVDEHISM